MKSNHISKVWNSNLAYAVGLITTDGSLSKDGRHIDFTSKDFVQVQNLLNCLGLKTKISGKKSGSGKLSYRAQIGNVEFYRFLESIGLFPKKSLLLGSISVPSEFFGDFLRGHFDGDGSFFSYYDPRWKKSLMFYSSFVSASKKHITWLRSKIKSVVGVAGHTTKSSGSVYQLKFAKRETLHLLAEMYYNHEVVCLDRKRKKVESEVKI